MDGTKTCRACGETKPFSQIVRDTRTTDGYANICLTCNRLRGKQYRNLGLQSASRRANPVATQLNAMISNSRVRARDKGLDHNLDLQYLRSIAPTHCPYLGTELRWEALSGHGRPFPNSPSLDRIDSSRGYVKGNVAIVSYRANSIKNDATEQELFRIGRALSLLKAEMAFPE